MKGIQENLPPVYGKVLLPSIKAAYLDSGKTIIVLDDDPTGTQTSYEVPVLSHWDVPLLIEELEKKPSILFVSTNSRSFPEQEAIELSLQVGKNLKTAVDECQLDYVLISRSDSTLRGHFPAEVNAIARAMDLQEAVWVLIPAFIEGGRYTLNDVHYFLEKDRLIPVARSPFARDQAFGYTSSDLKEWVEEKSLGKIKSEDVISISLTEIRTGGPEAVCDKLLKCKPADVCIVNALDPSDLEVFAMGSILAENRGKKFIFRSSATFVPIRAGIPSGKKAHITGNQTTRGSLTIVGSYVPKTTEQLNFLIDKNRHFTIEIDVFALLSNKISPNYLTGVTSKIDKLMREGKDVLLYTSRELARGDSPESSLKINRMVSEFLIQIVQGIAVRPSFIIAKGGITSNDIAVKALQVKKAMVLGQILPGIPVWELGKTSRFPDLNYVLFPGNVGEKDTLWKVFSELKSTGTPQ
ncbi:MAG TPA: four-carbon acid sugar kinase family protein [Cyclobacteriaceae bacterium]|nr:four-carbon acid sugar kinase family protein [Cyclobacteriaceae bacterium]